MIPCRCSVVLGATVLAAVVGGCGGKAAPPVVAPPPLTIASAPLTIAAPQEAAIKAVMTLTASADANPDATGRPSPVVVRVYQLKTDAGFKGAEFFSLFDDDQKVLGPEFISRDEFVLAPAERRTVNVTVAGDTRFVAAIAAFRDIRNSQWRGVVPAPRKGLTVGIERARVVLSVVD